MWSEGLFIGLSAGASMRWVVKLLGLVGVVVWLAVLELPDNRLRVYFCDVGQGDATLVTWRTTQILVDGGPDGKVVDCLETGMLFYDRRLEVVVLTHPQADHYGGLVEVAKRYEIGRFVIGPEGSSTQGYRQLAQWLRDKRVPVVNVYSGDKIVAGALALNVIWPVKEYVWAHLTGSPSEETGPVLGVTTDGTDLNNFSIVARLTYGDFDLLLTGDADSHTQLSQISTGLLTPVEVLKVPHHGSKTGMLSDWLALVRPQLAVISVGRNNRYGHPGQETLDMLQKVGARIYRTDQNGTINIISDGRSYSVKPPH